MAKKGREPYKVKESGWTPGYWAVYKNGSETSHSYRNYNRAIRKAGRLNRAALGRRR